MNCTKLDATRKQISTPVFKPSPKLAEVERALFSWKHRLRFSPTADNAPSLFSYLSEHLSHIDSASWRERSQFGGLYMNGNRVTADRALKEESIIEYYEPKYRYQQADEFYPAFDTRYIVYEDDHFAVVFKPTGLPTHPNKEQSVYSLRTYLEQHYKRRVHLPSRLDTGTCGLIPVSIHSTTHEQIQRLFERRLVTKRYLCEVSDPPQETQFRISAPIGRSELHAVLRRVDEEHGAEAVTDIDLLGGKEEEGRYTVLATPITGRTHQIRVHLAAFVGPIVGDKFYGGEVADTLHLMCAQLSLFHPVLRHQVTVTVPEELRPGWAKSVEIPPIS